MRVKRIARGQFRTVLTQLPEKEAEILSFKWGFTDGQARSSEETSEHFNISIDELQQLESRALNMVTE